MLLLALACAMDKAYDVDGDGHLTNEEMSRMLSSKKTMEEIDRLVQGAEMNLISTTPGAVPPHVDDGGHLPFGGTIGGTRGPSAFGKRKLTTANALGNPQALLLNYPPEPTKANLTCWERNCAPPAPGIGRRRPSAGHAILPSSHPALWGALPDAPHATAESLLPLSPARLVPRAGWRRSGRGARAERPHPDSGDACHRR